MISNMGSNAEVLKSESIRGAASKVLNNLTKSPADKREFRALELENSLKVLLIHDKDTDKSAGALSVAAGSMCDPIRFPGLAHFLEHMLFLGTEKYPEESSFDAVLSENGVATNAYTSLDTTVYYFEVSPEKLSLVLDRFAQFFISPLFNEDATEREVNAVNSENEKNIPNDSVRLFRVNQATCNQDHPFSKFNTGNRESLWVRPLAESLDVRSALIEFHRQFYSSNIMGLTVLGKESLDELQDLVQSLFSLVVNKGIEKPIWHDSPYSPEQLQLRIDVLPIQDVRSLTILFPIPDTTPDYKSGPGHYVTHLVGHEGEGSLLSLLKKKSWANELSCGASSSGTRGFGNFSIKIQVTVEGWENIDSIIEHVFQYLKLLQENEPEIWIWEEIKDIQDIRFRFQDKPNPGRSVMNMVEKIQIYPMEDILTASSVITDYNPKLIKDVLNCLTPSKCRITTASKSNEAKVDLTEPWYGVKYSVQKVDQELIERWTNCGKHKNLHLPLRNEFIPSVFDLKPREDTGIIPRLLINNTISRAWFLQDNEFFMPKAKIYLEIFSPLPLLNPAQMALNSMMKKVIVDSLNEATYPAHIAGLFYSISASVYGIEISVGGYNHKLKALLDKVLEKFISFSVQEDRFTILKEIYTRALKNWENSEPRVHASWYLSHVLAEKDWENQQLLTALQDMSAEDLRTYVNNFVSQLKLEWLICGNLTSSEAEEMVLQSERLFVERGTKQLLPDQLVRLRSIQLPSSADEVFKRDHLSHSSSCVIVYLQGAIKNTRDNVILDLLHQIARQPCFQQLRTEEQLGYIVNADVRKILGVNGLLVLVQSNFHPTYLECRVDNFLQNLLEKLEKMTTEQFDVFRTALTVRKSEKLKTLSARAQAVWKEIGIEEFDFDRQNVELKELQIITQEEIVIYFKNLLNERGRLGVHIISQTKDGAGQKLECYGPHPVDFVNRTIQPILDLPDWKSRQSLCERPKPVMVIPPADQ